MTGAVAIDARARAAWPDVLPAAARPGSIWVGAGVRLRVLPDGSAEEVGEVPRRWSIAADPCAARRAS